MQVKTFLGKDPAQVLAQVKDELGPEAVILTSRDVSKGSVQLYEVVAGVERDELVEMPAEPANAGNTRAPGPGWGGSAEDAGASGAGLERTVSLNLPMGWRQWHRDWTALREHILALLKPEMRLERLSQRQRLAMEFLQREGVDDEVIIKVYRSLCADGKQSIISPLAEIVKVRPWGFANWRNKVHMVTGPFGSGKTVTALRMGMALRDEKADAVIAVINADCERGQGRLILKHYCELLDVIYNEASNAAEMRTALENSRGADKVVIDLPGLASDETLTQLLQNFGLTGRTPLHLVLTPYFSTEHIRGLLTAYEAERCASLIWTKLDEAYSFGSIANAAAVSGLPVSGLSFSPGLTGSFCPAQAIQIWHLLFKHELPSSSSMTLTQGKV